MFLNLAILKVQLRGRCVCGAVTASTRVRIVHAVVYVMVKQQCFGCVDGRMQLRAGVKVLSI